LVGKPEGKRPLRIPRCGWEDNIKIDVREIGFSDVDWIYMVQEHGNETSGSIKCREILDHLSVLSASQEGLCFMELVN
jgi:hypothetical protein